MTNDYKNTLLRYFTGNLNQDPIPSNNPVFRETTTKESTIYSYIYENAGSGFTVIGILQGYNSLYSIAYGNTSSNKGFMVILDENNIPVQYIDSYNTGTEFGKFQILNVAEDGNLYGVDINDGIPRFIMLNNVTIVLPNQSEFIVKLRQSYNLPSPLSTASSYFAITKAVGQGKYLFGATTTSGSIASPLVTELTINVGATNDWVDYSKTITNNFVGSSIWASWNQDELDFKISGYEQRTTGVYYTEFTEGTDNTLVENVGVLPVDGYASGYYDINTILINKDMAYIGIYDGGASGESEKNSIIYSDGEIFQLIGTFQKGTTTAISGIDRKLQFKLINGNVYFMCKCYEQYSTVNDLYIYYGMIEKLSYASDPTVYYTNVVADGTTSRYDFLVSNIYNLYTYNILSFDFNNNTSLGNNYSTKQIYNLNNYNGVPYEHRWSLIPHTGQLFDNTDSLIFARNLYNNTVTNNTTLSVLQVPNTMLNDITIKQQLLLGETNKILTVNTEDLVKNIYETVYYNFYHTLMIEDRNTPMYIENEEGASRINDSTSSRYDYNLARATLYKINYSDESSRILPIIPTISGSEEPQTITGTNSLTVPNAKAVNVINYTTDGVCEQSGTPTPDSPIEVKTIPSIINLFDINSSYTTYQVNVNIQNNSIILTNTGSYCRIMYKLENLTVGKTYIFHADYINENNDSIQLRIMDSTNNTFKVYGDVTTSASGNAYVSFTATETTQWIRLYSNTLSSTNTNTVTFKNLMFEEGSISHEYIPYGYWSKVKVTGKNMFDKNNFNSIRGTINATYFNGEPNGGNKTLYIRCSPNITYTVQKRNDGDTNRFAIGSCSTEIATSGRTTLTTSNIDNSASYLTITTGENDKYLLVMYYRIAESTLTEQQLLDSIQIEESSTATTYEPYKENQVLIDMSKPSIFDITQTPFISRVAYNSSGVQQDWSGYSGTVQYTNVNSSTTYSINTNSNPYTTYIVEYDNSNTFIQRTTLSNYGRTFTTTANTKYIKASISDETVPTTFEIYASNNNTPYYELCKIGDYKDTLNIDDSGNVVINKNIGKIIANGSETWTQASSQYTGLYTPTIQKIDMLQAASGDSVMSNYFNKQLYTSQTQGITKNSANYILIRIDNTIANSISTFKTWLSTHNTEIYYPLATPETITLPNTTIPLYKGINHVTFVDTLTTNTTLEYQEQYIATYNIDVYVPIDKTIDSLEIISEDENTVYQTIDTSSLENGKIYNITQDCYVE